MSLWLSCGLCSFAEAVDVPRKCAAAGAPGAPGAKGAPGVPGAQGVPGPVGPGKKASPSFPLLSICGEFCLAGKYPIVLSQSPPPP